MNEKTRRIFRRRLTLVIGVFLIIGFVGYLFINNAIKLYELEQQKSLLVTEINDAKNYGNQLDEEVKQMGTRNYVEYIARKYLGLYYPDEVIVIPVEGQTSQPGTEVTPPITPLPENSEKKSEESPKESVE
ncbi:MAG: FtsB family cell division protein [Eubacteriaceae bacterium]